MLSLLEKQGGEKQSCASLLLHGNGDHDIAHDIAHVLVVVVDFVFVLVLRSRDSFYFFILFLYFGSC